MSDNDFYCQFFDSDNVSGNSLHGFELEILTADESDIDLDILVENQKYLDRLLKDEYDVSTSLRMRLSEKK